MDKLDLTQPLEAVHRDTGAVLLVSRRKATERGVFFVNPMIDDRWYCFELSGRHVFAECPWYIRNADLTANPSTPSNEELTQRMEIAPETQARMVALVRRMASDNRRCFTAELDEARSIVSDLPKPVDPIDEDLIEARECVARVYEGAARPDLAESTRAGKQDNRLRVQSALLAIARGRELGGEA